MEDSQIQAIHDFIDKRAKDNAHVNNSGRLVQRWNELFAKGNRDLTPSERKEKRQLERKFGIL